MRVGPKVDIAGMRSPPSPRCSQAAAHTALGRRRVGVRRAPLPAGAAVCAAGAAVGGRAGARVHLARVQDLRGRVGRRQVSRVECGWGGRGAESVCGQDGQRGDDGGGEALGVHFESAMSGNACRALGGECCSWEKSLRDLSVL